MRIVAGQLRGSRLIVPEGGTVRPTADRTRESLFGVLEGGRYGTVLRDQQVLDVFAGSGALGLEALSRGAAKVMFIESNGQALRFLENNIRRLRVDQQGMAVLADATRALRPRGKPARLVLMDPPYKSGLAPRALSALDKSGWLAPEVLVVIEMSKAETAEEIPGFVIAEQRRYGAARLVFMVREGSVSAAEAALEDSSDVGSEVASEAASEAVSEDGEDSTSN
jgi:16S rRNA (guanine966-N2)-methyltransferase